MKVNEFMKTTKVPLFLKDMVNKTFLYDGNAHVKKIKIAVSWKNNERYSLKVVFEGQGRNLILTERALYDLCTVVRNCQGTIATVKFEGKQGERKGTHWLFSLVPDNKSHEAIKPEFSIKNLFGMK